MADAPLWGSPPRAHDLRIQVKGVVLLDLLGLLADFHSRLGRFLRRVLAPLSLKGLKIYIARSMDSCHMFQSAWVGLFPICPRCYTQVGLNNGWIYTEKSCRIWCLGGAGHMNRLG